VQTIVVAFSDRLNGVTDLTVIYVSQYSIETNKMNAGGNWTGGLDSREK
jgi:hypothetical protein